MKIIHTADIHFESKFQDLDENKKRIFFPLTHVLKFLYTADRMGVQMLDLMHMYRDRIIKQPADNPILHQIYSIDGSLVGQFLPQELYSGINLNQHGCYIVKAYDEQAAMHVTKILL